MTDRVVATAPVRVADVGGWTDTWFGSPGQVCHLAVGPGVRVEAVLDDGAAGLAEEFAVEISLPSLGEARYALIWRSGHGWVEGGGHPLVEHAIAVVLEGVEVPECGRLSLEITSAVPAGASLGTSASVVVAVVGALDALLAGGLRPAAEVAVLAHQVETVRAGREAGVQDQWAAAFGGAGLLAVGPYPDVRHRALDVSAAALEEVGERLVTVVFGPHDSSAVHAQVINAMVGCGGEAHDRARSALRRLSSLAADAARALEAGDVDGWAAVLTDSARVQADLHPDLVGEPHQRAIELVRSLGAAGWKVNGAGGSGGSLTVVAGSGASAASAHELSAALAAADPTWQLVDLAPLAGLTIDRTPA